MKTGRCDKCLDPQCVIVLGSPIMDREERARLSKFHYDWCLDCARLKYPNFTLAQQNTVQLNSGTSTRKKWFEVYEEAAAR